MYIYIYVRICIHIYIYEQQYIYTYLYIFIYFRIIQLARAWRNRKKRITHLACIYSIYFFLFILFVHTNMQTKARMCGDHGVAVCCSVLQRL